MTSTWHVWTDGSCAHGVAQTPKGGLGWGGWAALVEHGSEGFTLHGRVPETTNVRMELLAAVEGLRAVPDDTPCVLHTDCTTVGGVFLGWQDGAIPGGFKGPDARLWLELDAEFERVRRCAVQLVVRGQKDPRHSRMHTLSRAEAQGGLKNLPPNAQPIPKEDLHHLRKHMQKQAVRSLHARGCTPALCVQSCPVRAAGAAVYGSRRRSEAGR